MKTAIIGFGHLGHALAEGLIKSGSSSGADISVCDKMAEVRNNAAEKYGVYTTDDMNDAINRSQVVFLTLRSNAFIERAPLIERKLFAGKTVVSFMAGVTFEKIYSLLGHVDLVRGMPSLAIAACDGVIAYTEASEDVVDIFEKLGYAFKVDPDNIEKVMAFSSCGLGFAAYLIDSFAEAGQSLGFSKETSEMIAEKTFKNALDRGNYKETVKAVATKGGATEQGVLHMDANNIYGIVSKAVEKAYDRMK